MELNPKGSNFGIGSTPYLENLHINFKMSNPNSCSFEKEEWFNNSNYVHYLKQQREKEKYKEMVQFKIFKIF
jgi:hypothetical protein